MAWKSLWKITQKNALQRGNEKSNENRAGISPRVVSVTPDATAAGQSLQRESSQARAASGELSAIRPSLSKEEGPTWIRNKPSTSHLVMSLQFQKSSGEMALALPLPV